MSQREVLVIFNDNNGWITADEIYKKIGFLTKQSISESLKRLYKGGYLEKANDDNVRHGYKYRLKNE